MMKTSLSFLGLMLLSALLCGPAWPASAPPAGAKMDNITVSGGPGDTLETAWVISGASNSAVGVAAEYVFLEKTFGKRDVDWKLKSQSLRNHKGRVYDRMEIHLKHGGRKIVFFDISDFFGKI